MENFIITTIITIVYLKIVRPFIIGFVKGFKETTKE